MNWDDTSNAQREEIASVLIRRIKELHDNATEAQKMGADARYHECMGNMVVIKAALERLELDKYLDQFLLQSFDKS